MAFVIENETKYTPTLKMVKHVYKEQEIAIQEIRMDEAARAYWKKYQETGDRGMAVDLVRGILTVDELHSEDFWHILEKRRP